MRTRTSMIRPILSVLLVQAIVLLGMPVDALAGAFIFSGETNGVNVIAHPQGYNGTGGVINVSVCIDPTSANAAAMVNPVQNAIATWNALAAVTPNLLTGANNDVPANQNDFESTALHEIGHCIGLAHVNAATESNLTGNSRNYTKATDGADNMFNLGSGADFTIGSSDDVRGDDVNLHWYVDADNNPCNTTIGTNDNSTMSRGLGNLPGGHLFAANADQTVCNNLGFGNTEAVMQQGQPNDQDQRQLGGDDVRTLRLGMSGLDEAAGTADDYTINLTYAGLTTACNIPLDFDNTQTGFAVCNTTGNFLDATHIAIATANIFFNTTGNYYFNPFLGDPPVCDAAGAYSAECDGTTTDLSLDGSNSFDPEGGSLSYSWTSTCPGDSFDDATSDTPTLTVGTSPGCDVSCGVELTVTDEDGNSVSCDADVDVDDTLDPTATCPGNLTIECDQPTDPANTGMGAASDVCDPTPSIGSADAIAPGACPQEFTITRAWTATDECGLMDSCDQIIDVVDTMAPVISCNAPPTVKPNQTPLSFTATAVDNCDGQPEVEVTSFDCFRVNGSGKVKSKLDSCIIDFTGSTLSIQDSGGVGDTIQWTVSTADDCGNPAEVTCEVQVVHPQ